MNEKIGRITHESGEVTLQSNITDEWTDILTYRVPNNNFVVPLDLRIFRMKLTTSVEGDLGGGSGDIDLSGTVDIPEPRNEVVGKVAQVYEDIGATPTEVTIDDINYMTAASNPNKIDTAADGGLTSDEKVYTQFAGGGIKIDVEHPAGGHVKRMNAGSWAIRQLQQANYERPDQAPRLNRAFPMLEKMLLHVSVKTSQSIDWGNTNGENNIAYFWLPVAFGKMENVPESLITRTKRLFGSV